MSDRVVNLFRAFAQKINDDAQTNVAANAIEAICDLIESERMPDTRWRLTENELPDESCPVIAWKPRDGPPRTWWFSKGYMRNVWRVDGHEVLPPTHWMPNINPPMYEGE